MGGHSGVGSPKTATYAGYDAHGFEADENPMMESVDVDLNKHLKPKGFPGGADFNAAQMFDHPLAAAS